MRRHSLTAELRKTFVSILGAVLAATTLTYALGVWLLFWGEDRFLRPENYAEQVIDEAEGLIDQDGVQILTSKGEEQIQQLIKGEGVQYQILDREGKILSGTYDSVLFHSGRELMKGINTSRQRDGGFVQTIPVFEEDGSFEGAVLFYYQMKIQYLNWGGRFLIGAVNLALISPVIYLVLFGIFFSKRFLRKIRRPLQILKEAAEKIKEQNLDFIIDYHEKNELGDLCAAFSEMQAALRESLTKQWKLEEERVEMVEALAHDLKTPISVIKAYAESLEDDTPVTPEQSMYLKVISENVDRSTSLIQKMQDVSKLEKEQTLSLAPTDLVRFLSLKTQAYEIQAKKKEIAVRLDLKKNLDAVFLVDQEGIGRILDNLVSNSLEYTPSGGEIKIAAWREEEMVFYEVTDTGHGFSEKDKKKAAEKFYRGDEARQTRGGHSGLGLYIVQRLTEQMGGGMQIDNTLSGGACVRFWHPAKKNEKNRKFVNCS